VRRSAAVLLALCLAGLLGYAAWRTFWPTEEDRLRHTLRALGETASTPEQEGDLPRLARVQRIADYLLEEVTIDLGGGIAMSGRAAIVGALAQASASGPVRIRIADVAVQMEPGERTAAVIGTVEIEQRDPRSGAGNVDAREVQMTWVRPEKAWVLSAASVVKPLH
jgi:hypothetical protein